MFAILPSGAAAEDFPHAVGGGSAGTLHFAFSARLGPNGPSGNAVVTDPTLGRAQGDVVCFRPTSPGQVVFYIEVKKGSGFLGSRPFVSIFAADFGAPFPDAISVSNASSPGSCVQDSGFGGQVTQGSIAVK